jgi:hypothetical protein
VGGWDDADRGSELGAVVWQENAFDHAWELLAGEVNAILVEVKSANDG